MQAVPPYCPTAIPLHETITFVFLVSLVSMLYVHGR
jgi:hypothetical protein